MIAANTIIIQPQSELYDFGILISEILMDWMHNVAGHLKSDYRYSAKLI